MKKIHSCNNNFDVEVYIDTLLSVETTMTVIIDCPLRYNIHGSLQLKRKRVKFTYCTTQM